MPIRILIVDDHGVLRAGLRALLNGEPNLQVIGEAPDGEQAIRFAQELRPDIMLLDISMPGMTGLEAIQQIKKVSPETRILILTVHEDKAILEGAIRCGAAGYIVKRAAESELVNAIYAVSRGDLYVHPSMTRALLASISSTSSQEDANIESLSSREADVLRLVVQGHTNRQIATLLNLSVRTVETHRSNVMAKLNLHTRAELVQYASRHGMLDLANNKG